MFSKKIWLCISSYDAKISHDILIAMFKCYQFFPGLCFQELPLIARYLKHLEGQKHRKYDRYFWGKVSKSNFRGEVCSFWRMGWAMLDNMIRWKKSVLQLQPLTIFKQSPSKDNPRMVKAVTTAFDIPNSWIKAPKFIWNSLRTFYSNYYT